MQNGGHPGGEAVHVIQKIKRIRDCADPQNGDDRRDPVTRQQMILSRQATLTFLNIRTNAEMTASWMINLV